MPINCASEKSLNMKGGSILFHFVINAFSLTFVADISSPCFLNGDSSTGSVDDIINIKDQRFVIVLES